MKPTLYKKIVVEQYGLTNELSLSDVYTKAKNAKNSIKKYFTENPTKAKLLTGQALLSLTVSIVKLMQGGTPDEDIQNIIQKKVETLNTAPVPPGQAIASIDKVSDQQIVVNVQTQEHPEISVGKAGDPNPTAVDATGTATATKVVPDTDKGGGDEGTVNDKIADSADTFSNLDDNLLKNGTVSVFRRVCMERTEGPITSDELKQHVISSYKMMRRGNYFNDAAEQEKAAEDAIKTAGAYEKLYASGAIAQGDVIEINSVFTLDDSELTYTPTGTAPIDNIHSQQISSQSKSEYIQHIIVSNGSGKILYEFDTTARKVGNLDEVFIDAVKFHGENLGITDEEAGLLANALYGVSAAKEVQITAGTFSGVADKHTSLPSNINPIAMNEKNDTKEYANGITKIKNTILADSKKQADAAIAAISNKSKDSLLAKIAYIVYKKGKKSNVADTKNDASVVG